MTVVTIGAGIGSSLGLGYESAWGTFATPTRWVEFASGTLGFKPIRPVGEGLAAGNVLQRSATRQTVYSSIEGEIKTAVYFNGFGLFLAALMGTLPSAALGTPGALPVSLGGGAYGQTHGLAANNIGQSLSFQVGLPEASTGIVQPYSFQGCKITKGVFECSPGTGKEAYLNSTFTVDGRTFDHGISTFFDPEYQLPNPIFSFNMAGFAIGEYGSEVVVDGIRKLTLTIERPMDVGRYYQNGTGLKEEQIVNGFTKITMDIESDYITDAEFCAQFALDTQLSVIWSFTGPEVGTSGFSNLIKFALPAVRWEEGPPTVTGPGLIQPKLKLIGLNDDVHTPPASVTYVSADAF